MAFKYKINFFNIIKNVGIIMVFLMKSFNIILIIKKKKIVKILNIKILNLKIKIKFTILNNFAIILQLN